MKVIISAILSNFAEIGRDVLAAVVRVNVPGKSLATASVTTEEELGFICDVKLLMSGTWASSREFDV
ncbi:unnamed protein product, partial [Porites lobata]